MNGLLDFIKTPEGQGLLSAAFGGLAGAQRGAPINSIGRAGMAGLAGYSNALDRQVAEGDREFNQKVKAAQLRKMDQEAASDAARTQFLQGLMNPGVAALTEGSKAGDVGPTVTNAQRMNTGTIGAFQKLPQQAVQADLAINGGKNIAEWLFKTGIPDMQVSNGYAFDKNNVQPGFLPGMSVSTDGRATLTMPGTNGLPVVSAPAGALETYGAYRGIDEGTKASYDPMPITTPDGTTVMTTRRAVSDATKQPTPKPSGDYRGPGYAGGSAAAAATDQRAILLREREAAVKAGRTQDIAALDREIARLPGGAPVPGIQVQSEPQKVRDIEGAKNAAASEQSTQKDRTTARKFLNQAKYAEELLTKNPTGSGLGAVRDNVLGFFGQSTPASETAKQLEAVAGWLVSNVPRMEGPQSNFDVDNYMRMAGAVGDKTKPVSERLAALRTIQQMMNDVMGGGHPQQQSSEKSVVRKGRYNGRSVVQYSDGSMEYAD